MYSLFTRPKNAALYRIFLHGIWIAAPSPPYICSVFRHSADLETHTLTHTMYTAHKHSKAFASLISKEIKIRNKSLASCHCVERDDEIACYAIPVYGQVYAMATFGYFGKILDLYFVYKPNSATAYLQGERVNEFMNKLTNFYRASK